MAENDDSQDKIHEPTQHKLDEAIKKGDLAKSLEVNTWFVLGGLTLTVLIASGPMTDELIRAMRTFLAGAHAIPADGAGLRAVARSAAIIALAAIALPLLIAVVAGLAGGMIQNRPLWTTQPLAPKLSRISPKSGAKRVFGKEALAQFVKGLAKIGLVGALLTAVVWGERERLETFARLDIPALLPATHSLALKMLGGVVALFAFVAVGDLLYTRFTWRQRQRMTQRELKEEFKQTEGNPEIKAKIKQLRTMRARRRMMQQVPQATVILANPTHYSVALKYEAGMPAPICVAKGVDALALRIREVAGAHGIPVVENPPLARALHASANIDAEIPVEHYKAVAEVIGYVLRLRRRAQ